MDVHSKTLSRLDLLKRVSGAKKNERKLTYTHLYFQNFFRGLYPRTPVNKGKGRRGEGRGREGRKKEGWARNGRAGDGTIGEGGRGW
jgi:hypothetical protein